MRGLEGKVALITGGGRGIGRGTALRLAEEGVSGLVLNDIDEEPLHEVVQKAKSLGVQAVSLAGSVTDSALATKLVKLATNTFGDLHCVVTSAGFPWGGVIHKVTDEQWQTIIDVHLTGTFWVVREAMGFMRERGQAGAGAWQRAHCPQDRYRLLWSCPGRFRQRQLFGRQGRTSWADPHSLCGGGSIQYPG